MGQCGRSWSLVFVPLAAWTRHMVFGISRTCTTSQGVNAYILWRRNYAFERSGARSSAKLWHAAAGRSTRALEGTCVISQAERGIGSPPRPTAGESDGVGIILSLIARRSSLLATFRFSCVRAGAWQVHTSLHLYLVAAMTGTFWSNGLV